MNDHWYMMADADPDRPMTPDEAAEWLRLRELGYSDGAGRGGAFGSADHERVSAET